MDSQGELNVFDYARVIWRAGWWIVALTVLTAAVAFAIARAQPKFYVARATILPPKESLPQALSMSLGGMFMGGGGREGSGGMGGLMLPGGISLGMPATTTNVDVFLALLKSRTMREEVVAEFTKTWGPSVGSLIGPIEPDTRQKIIALTVEARDPKLAADLANGYFAHLERRLDSYAELATRRQESFYAAQLDRAAKEVHTAEDELMKFQGEHRFIPMDPAMKAGAESGGTMRGNIMALELQREVLRMRVTEQHPQLLELNKQIAELKRQYSKNLFGGAMELPPETPGARGPRREYFVPTDRITPVQLAFLKLYRNLKIQEAFYTAALQGLEQIKYGDGVSATRVEILDPALPPTKPARPNVFYIVLVAAVSALVVGVLLAFVLEYLARVRAQERLAREEVARRPRRPDARSEPPGIALVDGQLGKPADGRGDGAGTIMPAPVPARRSRS